MSKVKSNHSKSLRSNKKLFIVSSAFAILISFIYSYKLRWLGDDIFIGFRYVQNFLNGHGLVYNVGERVEGYTDFLWLILISLFTWLKIDPQFTVLVLGILSSVGTLILFSIITYKITYPRNRFIVPFVTLALALNYDFNVWATSGLETSFYSFLLCASFYIFFFSQLKGTRKYFVTGLILCFALLTRPDAALIIAFANVVLGVSMIQKRIKLPHFLTSIFIFNLANILIYLPYFIWKYNYYGFIFPNTYYVKLGYESLFLNGFYYIWIYFIIHFVSFLVFIFPAFLIYRMIKKTRTLNIITEIEKLNSGIVASLFFVFVYLLFFVAKVGGDFMFARFIIPVVPFLYLIIYYTILKTVKESKLNIVFTVLLFLSFIETGIRFKYFEGYDEIDNPKITLNHGIADERDVYVNYAPLENEAKLGKAINRAFKGLDAKLLIAGGQACFGYYADFPYCQEMHGLADTLIAHSRIKSRGRIGHEKVGTLEYFENKGIDFLFYRYLPTNDKFRLARLILPPFDIDISLVTYQTDIMKTLLERFGSNIQFTDFPAYLDDYIKNQLPNKTSRDLKNDFDNFNLYYFKHNNDKFREMQFLNLLIDK